jgi:hypothetical protein
VRASFFIFGHYRLSKTDGNVKAFATVAGAQPQNAANRTLKFRQEITHPKSNHSALGSHFIQATVRVPTASERCTEPSA